MKNPEFKTADEILKKFKAIAKAHYFSHLKIFSGVFFDVLKIAYFAVKRKRAGNKGIKGSAVRLKRKEITKLVKLMDYFHRNDLLFVSEYDLSQGFTNNFNEADSLRFFETFVEGHVRGKSSIEVYIDLDGGSKFLYKNYATGKHEVGSEFFLPHRGKRLPWIRHTIRNTKNIYTKLDGKDREVMFIGKYALPRYDEEGCDCYWVVIAKKLAKDKVSPYVFKTAFPIFKYNALLKRVERYQTLEDARI